MLPIGEFRECFATNFDQTLIGKRSSAGRLERKAPRERNHVCGGTLNIAAARLEILRGADCFAGVVACFMASCEFARHLTVWKRDPSSGMDLATQVPAPVKVSR